LLACASAAALLTATIDANAGGLAVREQSTYGQGSSFAGIAAGGSLSAMFWNPATMTQFNGKGFEAGVSIIMPKSYQAGLASAPLPALGYNRPADNSGVSAAIPSTYASWQVSDRFWVGLGINAPFGLAVTFPQVWQGAV
jgi:long-chain fatty acid transport protein